MIGKIIASLIGCITTGIFGYLVGKVKSVKDINKTQNEAIKSLLRASMVSTYYEYKKERKIPYFEKESWYAEFESYTQLGGNSFIKDIKKEIDIWEIGE